MLQVYHMRSQHIPVISRALQQMLMSMWCCMAKRMSLEKHLCAVTSVNARTSSGKVLRTGLLLR